MDLRLGLLQNTIYRSLIFVRLFTTRLRQKAHSDVDYAVCGVGTLQLVSCKSLSFNYLQKRTRTGAFLRTTATLVHPLSAEIQ